MKRLIILALIALGCAVKQEIRYVRPDWPTPEEVRQDLGIPETDPIQAFTFDSTLAFEPLNSTEIAILETARRAYYHAVKDSFPDMGSRWWCTSMMAWLSQTKDSLTTAGKRYQNWERLMNSQRWIIIVEQWRAIDDYCHPHIPNDPDSVTFWHQHEARLDTIASYGFF